MKELIYTSAPSGLRPGSTGFCTVAISEGLAAPAVEFLERLSNTYRPVYMPYDARASENPTADSLLRVRLGGQAVFVLSRNKSAGVDHTGRTNNLAHHLVFDGPGELLGSNPAVVAATAGTFVDRWDDRPCQLPGRRLQAARGPTGACRLWAQIVGDPGWAATVASAWTVPDSRPFFVIYPTRTDILGLMAEAIGLLPLDRQSEATFTTYYTTLPPEAACKVRAVLAGTPQETEARRGDHIDLLDLAGPPPDGTLAERARGRETVPRMSAVAVGSSYGSSKRPQGVGVTHAAAVVTEVAYDEPPPAKWSPAGQSRAGQGTIISKSPRSTGRTTRFLAIAFGVLALFSSIAAVLLATGIAGPGHERRSELTDQPRADMDALRQAAERERDAERVRRERAEGSLAQVERKLTVVTAAPGRIAATIADCATGGLMMVIAAARFESPEALDRLERRGSEIAKPTVGNPLPAVPKATSKNPPPASVTKGTSPAETLSQFDRLPEIDKRLAYRRLDSVYKKGDEVVLGTFSLSDERIQTKETTRDVLKVESNLNKGKMTPSSRYVLEYWFLEVPDRYYPPPGEAARPIRIVINHDDDKKFFYIGSDQLPPACVKAANCVFVMVETADSKRTEYLMRLKRR